MGTEDESALYSTHEEPGGDTDLPKAQSRPKPKPVEEIK